MSLLQNFKNNALNTLRKPATKAMLCMMGVGGAINADAQQIKGQYYVGYGQVRSDILNKNAYNPYEDRGVLTVGGRISLADTDNFWGNHTGLVGEYRYYGQDPNKISGHAEWNGWGQSHSASYVHIPSRARLGVFFTTSTANKLQVQADANLLAYPGAEHNWANSAHFMAGAEIRYNLLDTKSVANLELVARTEYIAYNNKFWNRYFLDGAPNTSTTASLGVRLTLAPR